MNLFIFNSKSKKTKFVYLIILSVLFFTVLDRITFIVIQKLSSDFYNIPVSDFSKLKVSKKEREFYNTLILGSSRTKHGIYPWYLEKYLGLNSYKASKAGKYSKYNFYFYSIYKKKFKIPDYLIYGVDYFIFKQRSGRRKMNSLWGESNRKKGGGDSAINNKQISLFSSPSILLANKNMIETFIVDVIDQLTSKKKKDEIPLISTFRGRKKTIPPNLQKEPLYWKKFKYKSYPGREGKYFDMLLTELLNDKVKVFIVILPSYISVYKTNYQQNIFLKEIELLCSRFPNITLLSYNSPEKFDISNPKFFKNGEYGKTNSHLSYYGAEVLNKMLCDDISDLIDQK